MFGLGGSAKAAKGRRRIGLALGSGGARGLAHLGVLQRFAEWGLSFDCVAGTSIGAIAGAVLAAGRVDAVAAWAEELDWRTMARLFAGRPHSTGLLTGRQIDRQLRAFIPLANYEDAPFPFATVATDIATGSEVVVSEGDLLSGVHASFAIPGVFTTVERDGLQLVDGGVVNPLPISVCREVLGADAVVAVDINLRDGAGPRRTPRGRLNIFQVLANTIGYMEKEASRALVFAQAPDVLIQPAVGDIATLDFMRAREAIAAGRAAADEMRADVEALFD